MSADELAQQAGGGAAGNFAKKALNKAAGAAGKFIKKLLMKFLKQLILSLGKMILAFIGPWGCVIALVLVILMVVISSIPFADWFLGGNSRSDAEKNADSRYEQKFKDAADQTVAEISNIEADSSWKTDLIHTIKPSWGIPVALVRYAILKENKKINLSDYDANDLIKSFAPTYSYTTITDDTEWTKSSQSCTYSQTTTTTDEDGVKHEETHTWTENTDSTTSSKRAVHYVLSKVTLNYGTLDIKSLKKYYPGGTLTDNGQWEYSGTSTSGNCTMTTYKRYENTTVDDRFVPAMNIDTKKFQGILVGKGVSQGDMSLIYEFISAADTNWNQALYGGKTGSGIGLLPGDVQISALVSRYEPLVRKYAEKNGIPDLVGILLALIQQESGGRYLDVMQSSESLGLAPNTLTDPEMSIQAGVAHFASVYQLAGGDTNLALQAFNFGGGFINYAKSHGGYSKENAQAFSIMMATQKGWVSYGDPLYVDHVMRYYNTSIKVSSEGQVFDVQKVLDVMSKYIGLPYFWGGRTPKAGGFDCSGLMEYAFRLNGIDLGGNAETQYNKTVPVDPKDAKPCDLVFWSTYKDAASHVGMYLGNDKFINANNGKGVSYSSVAGWSSIYPFLGYRRIEN